MEVMATPGLDLRVDRTVFRGVLTLRTTICLVSWDSHVGGSMAAYMLIRLLRNAKTLLTRILWAFGQSTLAIHV